MDNAHCESHPIKKMLLVDCEKKGRKEYDGNGLQIDDNCGKVAGHFVNFV